MDVNPATHVVNLTDDPEIQFRVPDDDQISVRSAPAGKIDRPDDLQVPNYKSTPMKMGNRNPFLNDHDVYPDDAPKHDDVYRRYRSRDPRPVMMNRNQWNQDNGGLYRAEHPFGDGDCLPFERDGNRKQIWETAPLADDEYDGHNRFRSREYQYDPNEGRRCQERNYYDEDDMFYPPYDRNEDLHRVYMESLDCPPNDVRRNPARRLHNNQPAQKYHYYNHDSG